MQGSLPAACGPGGALPAGDRKAAQDPPAGPGNDELARKVSQWDDAELRRQIRAAIEDRPRGYASLGDIAAALGRLGFGDPDAVAPEAAREVFFAELLAYGDALLPAAALRNILSAFFGFPAKAEDVADAGLTREHLAGLIRETLGNLRGDRLQRLDEDGMRNEVWNAVDQRCAKGHDHLRDMAAALHGLVQAQPDDAQARGAVEAFRAALSGYEVEPDDPVVDPGETSDEESEADEHALAGAASEVWLPGPEKQAILEILGRGHELVGWRADGKGDPVAPPWHLSLAACRDTKLQRGDPPPYAALPERLRKLPTFALAAATVHGGSLHHVPPSLLEEDDPGHEICRLASLARFCSGDDGKPTLAAVPEKWRDPLMSWAALCQHPGNMDHLQPAVVQALLASGAPQGRDAIAKRGRGRPVAVGHELGVAEHTVRRGKVRVHFTGGVHRWVPVGRLRALASPFEGLDGKQRDPAGAPR